ncbi:hypothetical protein [Spiroplasma endosymbiont of Atherix ibis]|uniref:hypothetical protein n=1 Tax=Spiroplasma endosymbiont of Atherix ibis TaxID=3066291 RepID=UPI0030D5CFA2
MLANNIIITYFLHEELLYQIHFFLAKIYQLFLNQYEQTTLELTNSLMQLVMKLEL